MRKMFAVVLMIAGASIGAVAAVPVGVPEINPATAVSALTLLGGSILVLRARLKR